MRIMTTITKEQQVKPKIFAFSNVVGGGEGLAVALAEDGTALASHWCSDEFYVEHDLGVTSDWKHEKYREHYPDGFEVVYVPTREIAGHAGLELAFELNIKQSAPQAE